MNTENINFDLSNLDIEKIIGKETNSLIIQNSPTIKINIEEDNAFYITGFNMMCMQDKLKYDLSDLDDNTMLIISQHHISECILLIAGALRWLSMKTKTNIDINRSLHLSTQYISQQIIFYSDGELEVLDSSGYELWTDNGTEQKIITLGDLLKTTGITKIPLRKL